MTKIVIDGIPVKVVRPDLDGDGSIDSEAEILTQSYDRGVTSINQATELGESLKELNQDEIQVDTRMSGIDLRARLHPIEIASVLALDSLVGLGVVHSKCLSFTRQKKRLSVSLDGKGREEIVDIVGRKREEDSKKGSMNFGERFKNFLGME